MKHKKGCTFGWDGSCVIGCPYHPESKGTHRLSRVREASGVESKFIDGAKARYWKALKFVSPGLRGVPDRMVLKGIEQAAIRLAGLMDESNDDAMTMMTMRLYVRELLADCIEFAELKAPDKDATIEQMRRHEMLQEYGFTTSVLDSPAAVEQWYADRS